MLKSAKIILAVQRKFAISQKIRGETAPPLDLPLHIVLRDNYFDICPTKQILHGLDCNPVSNSQHFSAAH